ncbi:transcription factor bHLH90 [Quercus lobata]|uniref:BHLH domain-containing protein n=1 Tax=Quercus lobata TaxID=97700 RepID=A0A7N2L8P5_QUELO|nr:transcription factor bHLH90 [Quercus lobata]
METMRGLERTVEWLRPFVQTKTWDYCVVWKLGDDPSRFIEWMGCCCSGGYRFVANVKEERGVEHHLSPLCKDGHFQHPISTKACEALAQLPSSMPLYSGVHGEVVISTQPRWICDANALDSDISNDKLGTRVLIPVVGGLIELFVAKHLPKDQKIIEFITAQFNISLDQDAKSVWNTANVKLSEHHLAPLPEEYSQHWPGIQALSPVTQSSSYPSVEGLSSGSTRSSECPFDLNCGYIPLHGSMNQSIGKSSGSKKPEYNVSSLKTKLALNCGNVVEKEKEKVIQEPKTKKFHSKNLATERKRRHRIKDGLFTLRALVPKITKMDRAAIVGDAIEYIQELQKEVEQLNDELREMEEEDCEKNKAELKILKPNRTNGGTTCFAPTEQKPESSSLGEKKQTEVQVEVSQIGQRDFLIKIICEQKRGGFARFMEAIDSLGLQVADANVTTFCGQVLNILRVEANTDIKPKKLRDALFELVDCRLSQ